MPVRLILVRHAQTPHNATSTWAGRTDSVLTDLGHTQASHLGRYLNANYPRPSRIFVSPLQRTHLTASHLIPSPSDLPREIVPEIKERDFGPVDDTPHTQMPDPANVEPLETVARRADGFWDNWWAPVLAKTEEEEKNQQNGDKEAELIVAVSHGAYIPSLWERMVARWEVEGTNGEDVVGRWRNTAFCVLRFEKKKDGSAWKVVVERNMGTPHLEGTGAVTKQPIAGEEGANL